MSKGNLIIRTTFLALLILCISAAAFADTIRLKDGSIFKGTITSFANGKFTIVIGEGQRSRQLSFSAAEIDSIIFDQNLRPAAADPSNRNASYTPSEPPRVVIANDNSVPASQPAKKTSSAPVKPIEWNVKVLADNTSNGWTNTGWVVKKGQRIHISGDGTVSLGKGRKTTASGLSDLDDPNKLLKNVPTGALIAVIGDDNNDFIYIGADREITATRDGSLFLGINEGNLDDNSGSFAVKVQIIPDGQ